MAFVKLDCGILNSSVWAESVLRDVFLTALLMAEPYVTDEPVAQLHVRTMEPTGWMVPPGWYGFVPAAGIGIIRRALVVDVDAGLLALERLGDPEPESRSQEFEGRRLVRVDGGYVALNYDKYRERDLSAADRQRRYRIRKAAEKASQVTPVTVEPKSHVTNVTSRRTITQAEGEGEVEGEAEGKDTDEEPRVRLAPIQARRRKDAAWEGPRFYIPQRLHLDFVALQNQPDAEADLLAWYEHVSNEWTTGRRKGEQPDADMFVFWRARYQETWPASNAKSVGSVAARNAAFVEQRRR